MIPAVRDEILSRFPGSRQCYKLFINYTLQLRVKVSSRQGGVPLL